MTGEGFQVRARNRGAVWSAVFKEQREQHKKSIFDALGIAVASSRASYAAREEAKKVAREDASHVRQLLREESPMPSHALPSVSE